MEVSAISWDLRHGILHHLPRHINLWLSKSFVNFAGTAHQMKRWELVPSSVCRACNSADERDTMHVLDCADENFRAFRERLINSLQLDVMALRMGDIIPLALLEHMLSPSFVPIPDLPSSVNAVMSCFSRRDSWHGFVPYPLFAWAKSYDVSIVWLEKFFALCITMLHTLWVERCNIVHERTVSDVRVEDYHQLLVHARRLYRCCDIDQDHVLWQYRNRLSSLSSDTLRGIIYEFFSMLDDIDHGEGVTEHLQSLRTHRRTELSA